MSSPTEAVEGQAFAQGVLDALESGHTLCWDAFYDTYHAMMLRTAARWLRKRGLDNRLPPEDALHDFLVRKIYPERQARTMFGPPARGERPLARRLLASLCNHCADLARASDVARINSGPEGGVANIKAPGDDALATYDYEAVENLIRRRMTAIRAVPLRHRPGGPAYREALLLRLRLDWAELEEDPAVLTWVTVLEQLTAWDDEENTMPLVEGGTPLAQLWEQVRAVAVASPHRQVGVDDLAWRVPTNRDRWNQWLSRGRRKVQERLGAAEYARVFAVWDNQGRGP